MRAHAVGKQCLWHTHGVRGFSLVEVLVALLVLSIGLLGLAGLQLHALQYTHSSYQRTLVNIQALDMVERMWTHLQNPLTELAEWKTLNQASLPGWNGTVEPASSDPGDYVLTISWNDSRFVGAEMYSFAYRLRFPVLD